MPYHLATPQFVRAGAAVQVNLRTSSLAGESLHEAPQWENLFAVQNPDKTSARP